MGSQQFCLRWNNHQSNMLNVFDQLFQNEALVDVTLACDGLSLKAHKVVLSACSPYFQSLFLDNPCQHPIVFLKDVRYSDLKALVDFMYKGEVNVSQEQLNAVLETAESLKVKGLAEMTPEGPQQGRTGDISYHISKVIRNTASIGLNITEAPSKDSGGLLSSASPPPSPRPAITSSSSSSGQDQTKRCCSPPAKRRKAKPRKRIPENAIPSDHEDSDALDLSTASPELLETCMDLHDGSFDTTVGENRKTGVAIHLGTCSNNNNNGSSNNNSNALQSSLLHLDVEENVSPHEKDYNSNQNQAQASPSGTSSQRMPILSKVSPLVSVMAAAPLPSTSATQASIQDMLWSSERRIRSYHCEHCKQTFESKSFLYKHGCPKERVGFTCEVCSSSFPSHSRYLRHREIHNPDRETFTCHLCNKTMVRLDHLRTHMKNLHDIRRLCQFSRQSQQHKPTWTEEDMVQALEAVQSGRLTYALAARKFDIPKATLHYYVILMKAVEAVRSGRMTAEIAAIKYNVRTSILLDCLFGRQGTGTTTTSTATGNIADKTVIKKEL